MMMHRTRRTQSALPMREVLRIADMVAEEFGLQGVKPRQRARALSEEGEILRCLAAREQLPVGLFPMVRENRNGTLWVDSQYVAYQLGAGRIHYVYVTLYHIAEERITNTVQSDIAEEFIKARRGMRRRHRRYHVRSGYEREAMRDETADTAAGNAHSRV